MYPRFQRLLFGVGLIVLTLGSTQPRQVLADQAVQQASPSTSAPSEPPVPAPGRDLSVDEAMGGHTLARHVAKTDIELAERLRREPQISAASSYTDRATAERVVGTAIASAAHQLSTWQNRRGRRPNLVLDYTGKDTAPIGRSMRRGRQIAVPCFDAVVVLRWDERLGRYFVLTSYPENER
jgi:hypothetical protein